MKTIAEFLDKKANGDAGIEVEVECLRPTLFKPLADWQLKDDGSLRHYGYEFITRGALNCDDKKTKALKELFEELKEPALKDSPRTSVHVHTNCLGLTPLQGWTFITAYFLIENLLTAYAGPNRIGNLFCLRMTDAQRVIGHIISDLKNEIPFIYIQPDRVKYLGGNIGALPRFGSFEIRTMRGWYDTDGIDEWTNELINIRDNSKKFASPAQLLDAYWNNEGAILEELISKDFARKLKRLFPDWENMLSENAPLIAQYAYSQNWNVWAEKMEQSLEKRLKANQRVNKVVNPDIMWAQNIVIDEDF